MRLYTIQTLAAWEDGQVRGVLRCDEKYIPEEFRPYYDWMRSQMAGRLSGYRGGYPIWCWYQPREDLRTWQHWWRGPHVLIVCEVRTDRVLLSDHDAWHVVLNEGYLPLTDEEDHYVNQHILPPGRYSSLPSASSDRGFGGVPRVFSVLEWGDGLPKPNRCPDWALGIVKKSSSAVGSASSPSTSYGLPSLGENQE